MPAGLAHVTEFRRGSERPGLLTCSDMETPGNDDAPIVSQALVSQCRHAHPAYACQRARMPRIRRALDVQERTGTRGVLCEAGWKNQRGRAASSKAGVSR